MAAYLWNVTGEAPEGQKVSEEWVRLYPNDQSAYASLAADYLILGEFDKAAQACRKSLSLSPEQNAAYVNAMLAYQRLERYDEAKTIYDTARARNIESLSLRLYRYTIAFLENDDAGAKEQMVWAQGKKGSYDWLLGDQARAEAYYGRYTLSRESGKKAVAAALSDGATDRSLTHEIDAAVDEVEVGNLVLARRVATGEWPLTIGRDVKARIAYILAKIGDNAGAERLAGQLDRDRPLDTRIQKLSLPVIRALIELNNNNPERAVVLLQPALQFERADGYLGGLLPAYVRGLACLQAGKGPEAALEFQKLIDHPGIVSISVRGALARLQMARAKQLGGDHASARRFYQDFLALWKDADPDVPIFKQARAEYAALK
jgi:tetratricopeptide (TPR) repeat protein